MDSDRSESSAPAGYMPLVGATVTATGGANAVTNAQGAYTLIGVPVGQATVTITKTGYTTIEQQVTVTANQTTNVELAEDKRPAPAAAGSIQVTWTPQSLALDGISIDGAVTGFTTGPRTLANVSAGVHTIVVAKTGYTVTPASQVVAVTAGETATAAFTVTYDPDLPTISGFTPASGIAGAEVTISGGGFGATQGSTVVRFNGVVAACSAWSATEVVCAVPADATTGPISITSAAGAATTTNSFAVSAQAENTAPVISSFSAASRAVLAGGAATTLTVEAHDADGDALSYSWSTSGGSLTGTADAERSFGAAESGIYTVTVTVSDGRGGVASRKLVINCFGAEADRGGVRGTVSVPVQTQARVMAAGPASAGNILDGPVSIEAASRRDMSRVVPPNSGLVGSSCEGDDIKPGEVIVKLSSGGPLAAFAAERGLEVVSRVIHGIEILGIDVSGLDDAEARAATRDACAELSAEPQVEFAELNRLRRTRAVTPNDPEYHKQWHYPMINLPQAWAITTGSSSVIVAVLDTGIVSGHADLVNRLVPGYDFVDDAEAGCDGDGRDSDPEDVADSRCQPNPIPLQSQDHSGYHGAHVAGTIGAEGNNGVGVTGVNWDVRIMPVRVLGAGGGYDSDIAQGMLWAAGLTNETDTLPAKPAKIINMSLGGDPGEPCSASMNAVFNQVHNAGVSVFVAGGNEYSDTAINPTALCDNAIAVAAVDRDSKRAPYSNSGPGITIAAPGGNAQGVYSTIRNDATGNNTAYGYMPGTSMAAPHAAGVAALMLAANPDLTPTQIRTIMVQTATDLGTPGTNNTFGAGLINAYAAVLEAKKLVDPDPVQPPQPVIALSTSQLHFAQNEESKTVTITNTGTGTLTISDITPSATSGGNWLSASQAAAANSITLTVTVDRTTVPAGTYAGSISLTSTGGNATVAVTMQVAAPAAPPAPPGCADTTIWILAVDPDADDEEATVGQTDIPATGGAYAMFDVSAGARYIVAGTDCNEDGWICDEDHDRCGIYPLWADPKTVTVTAGQFLESIDFSVAAVTARRGEAARIGYRRR